MFARGVLLFVTVFQLFLPATYNPTDRSGYIKLNCGYGEGATVEWFVSGPGILNSIWTIYNRFLLPEYVIRTVTVPEEGFVIGYEEPTDDYYIGEVLWSSSVDVLASRRSCGVLPE